MTLRVLGRVGSINVRKVLWALDEIGVPYDREAWGVPGRELQGPEFLALNPNAQIPVVIDDGFVLWESNAILRYFADKHGKLLPDDPKARARVDQWLFWQVSELNPQWMYAVQALLRKNPAFTDPARIADSIAKWTAKLEVLEGQLQKLAFVAGDAFTIADIAIALSSHRWLSTPIPDRKAFPAIEAHHAAMKARAAAAAWMSADTP